MLVCRAMHRSVFYGSAVMAPQSAGALLSRRCALPRSVGVPAVRSVLQTAITESNTLSEWSKASYSAVSPRTEEAAAQSAVKPGELDDAKFQQHWSVAFWRDFRLPAELTSDEQPIANRLQAAARVISEAVSSAGVFASPKAAAYWTYHLSRSSFFLLQGAAGLLAARTTTTVTGKPEGGQGKRLERLLTSGLAGPVSEATGMFYQDYQHIEQGCYSLPWDMVETRNRQWSPLHVARRSAQFLTEAAATLGRRSRGKSEDVWLQSPLYPEYYRTFHYQTDGWLSEDSAKIYEVSTETLFLGRQDAMQRQALVPLASFMRGQPGRAGAGVRLLELACGTGRFASFIKDNWPEMAVTCLDLSPYYLHEARANLRRWARLRAPGLAMGSVDGNGTAFLQAAAENIPQPDGSFDVVTCVYLFHELPGSVRRAVAAEMARVLRPGGLVVLVDSVQLGDRPRLDANLGNFQSFNEPFYGSYIKEDFGALFKEAGLVPAEKLLASSSKVLSFRKPLEPGTGERAGPPAAVPAMAA